MSIDLGNKQETSLQNILIRTSNRPRGFNACIKSIKDQSFKNYNIFVSVDNKETENYVKPYTTDGSLRYLRVKKTPRSKNNSAPWNLYLNRLLGVVKSGWVFILDDDDVLSNKYVLEEMAQHMDDENCLLLWRMSWPNGRIIPDDKFFGKPPKRKHIGMPCFAFHSKWKKHVAFDSMRAGDYRVVSSLYEKMPRKKWIDKIMVNVGNTGNVGKKEK